MKFCKRGDMFLVCLWLRICFAQFSRSMRPFESSGLSGGAGIAGWYRLRKYKPLELQVLSDRAESLCGILYSKPFRFEVDMAAAESIYTWKIGASTSGI